MEGTVKSICISERKGTEKHTVPECTITEDGILGDAHAGRWHRQISLLSCEKVDEFNRECEDKGIHADPGTFGENLLLQGIDLSDLPTGTLLKVGTAVIKISQIGKSCHSDCEIKRRVGKCIMPVEGVFAMVVTPGKVKTGDTVYVSLPEKEEYKTAIVTVSDSSSEGKREDLSGPAIKDFIEKYGYMVTSMTIIPDDRDIIEKELRRIADEDIANLILTTGGTGFSPRDITPEATLTVSDRLVPGIPEAIRQYSMQFTDKAMLSRAAAGIRKSTLIINLPGSPKAVTESLECIRGPLRHGMDILLSRKHNCARK